VKNLSSNYSKIKEEYKNNGFSVVRGVFSGVEIAQLRTGCVELEKISSEYESDTFNGVTYFALHRDCNPFEETKEEFSVHVGELRRVTYPYALSEIFNKFRCHEGLLKLVSSILGNDINQIVNQVNFNPPAKGTGWGWHQDYRFRKEGIPDLRNNYLQSLVALDLCNTETGGVRIVEGSDHLELQLEKEQENAETYFDINDVVVPELNPGDVLIFNPFVIHGSGQNKSENQRRVFINGYCNGKVSSTGMPVMRGGEIISKIDGKMEYEGDEEKLPNASKY
jgi:ectoine hydroxylase-related dioxygenase (phytanoyl-CoA dioxygenase family)